MKNREIISGLATRYTAEIKELESQIWVAVEAMQHAKFESEVRLLNASLKLPNSRLDTDYRFQS